MAAMPTVSQAAASTDVRPRIGVTTDNRDNGTSHYEQGTAYGRAVAAAGGLPLLLTQDPALVEEYVRACDGFVLIGGDDLAMEDFGQATHPGTTLISPMRQAFEVALIRALDDAVDVPVLGVCMGMQLMAMNAGGRMHQHLPEVLGEAAEAHRGNRRHGLVYEAADGVLPVGDFEITSSHHQSVADPGRLRVVARAPDGVIEAIDDPSRPFYLGVQWHPERGAGEDVLNRGLFRLLTAAARCRSAT
jgi:putative glutamine amidotransferase